MLSSRLNVKKIRKMAMTHLPRLEYVDFNLLLDYGLNKFKMAHGRLPVRSCMPAEVFYSFVGKNRGPVLLFYD